MNAYLKWSIPVIVIAAAAVYWYGIRTSEVPVETVPAPELAAASSSTSSIQYPLSQPAEGSLLPTLDDSDTPIQASLQNLFGAAGLADLLIPTQIIRHIVATVDNLPREKLAVTLRPINATPGKFLVTGDMPDYVLNEKNYSRYKPFMLLVEMADTQAIYRWYHEYYPLFQEAYQNLGYPDGYFNDRLVQTIDNLLETPEISESIHLVQPKVFYEFADPSLEARSAGQKTLLRMGPDNIRIIKAKLRELRTAITTTDQSTSVQ